MFDVFVSMSSVLTGTDQKYSWQAKIFLNLSTELTYKNKHEDLNPKS